jgi:Protein of unknown function (DUF4058)
MEPRMSPQEIQHRTRGPLPGRIDLWAEADHYFQTIHADVIGLTIHETQSRLNALGYLISREKSLQVTEGREPDLYVLQENRPVRRFEHWNYELAATEALAEPGLSVVADSALTALYIRDLHSSSLVTVVEIISPGNKDSANYITAYQERRERLLLERGVNVVEIDLTRSIMRLTNNRLTLDNPYHVSVFLPGEAVRVIPIQLESSLPRIALPLRAEVFPVELEPLYRSAYETNRIAWQIEHDGNYTEDYLRFPSTLTAAQRQAALAAVQRWQATLKQLRGHEE